MVSTPEVATVAASAVTTGAVAWAVIKWFGEKAVEHALGERMESFKSGLEAARDDAKSRLDDTLRRGTELTLGDAAAERAYRYEARKRLYEAVGPLRFQLFQAALALRERITMIAEESYDLSMTRYFGRSTLYRFGRLIAIADLIDQQVAWHDFSVDDDMLRLLAFRTQMYRAFSSEIIIGHPAADWTRQKEHLFRDTVQIMAVSMLPADPPVRVLRPDEFYAVLASSPKTYMQPFAGMLRGLDPTKTPLLWTRLCTLAALCDALVSGDRIAVALDAKPFALEPLIDRCRDGFIVANRDRVIAEIRAVAAKLVVANGPGASPGP